MSNQIFENVSPYLSFRSYKLWLFCRRYSCFGSCKYQCPIIHKRIMSITRLSCWYTRSCQSSNIAVRQVFCKSKTMNKNSFYVYIHNRNINIIGKRQYCSRCIRSNSRQSKKYLLIFWNDWVIFLRNDSRWLLHAECSCVKSQSWPQWQECLII